MMQNDPSYYQLLDIDPSASAEEVKSAFRQQARRNHPDQGGNPTLFRMVNEAYRVLSDPSSRARYDARLRGELDEDDDDTAMSTVHFDDAAFFDAQPYEGASSAPAAGPRFQRARPSPGPLHHPRRARLFWAVIALWVAAALALNVPLLPGLGSGLGTVTFLAACWIAWVLGSFILRMLGWALIIGAIVGAQWFAAPPMETTVRMLMGAALWMAGQWLFAFRHQRFHSVLASGVLTRLPFSLRPDRRWASD